MTHPVVALACLGHLVLVLASHNRFYGIRLPKWGGDLIHLVHGLAILALPVGLVAGWGFSLAGLFDWESACLYQRIILVYLGLCLFVALVWFPILTLRRNLRRDPARVTSSQVVDIAAQLGSRPIGRGRMPWLARLPGNQLFQVEYVEKTLFLQRLPPAWEGLTLLHLSDLHLHGTPDRDYFRAVMDRCADWQPDLVAITGDITDSPTHHRWILPILGRLRWNIAAVAILGNHDHYVDETPTRRRLRRLGMHVPENTWFTLTVRGEPMTVVGNEWPWFGPEPDLRDCPEGPFRLCLSHTPDNIAWARAAGIDLMLSGHVHGGQVRLGAIGSILVPSKYGRRYDMGTFDEPPTLLHVSRGLSGEHPLRFGCRPEVTLLTLRRAEGGSGRTSV
jgi:predicted MPP superfamily phosphohydrolase